MKVCKTPSETRDWRQKAPRDNTKTGQNCRIKARWLSQRLQSLERGRIYKGAKRSISLSNGKIGATIIIRTVVSFLFLLTINTIYGH